MPRQAAALPITHYSERKRVHIFAIKMNRLVRAAWNFSRAGSAVGIRTAKMPIRPVQLSVVIPNRSFSGAPVGDEVCRFHMKLIYFSNVFAE